MPDELRYDWDLLHDAKTVEQARIRYAQAKQKLEDARRLITSYETAIAGMEQMASEDGFSLNP